MNVLIEAQKRTDRGETSFLDRQDDSGFTPLHWAVISHHFEFAKLLLKAGARTDVADSNGKTPRHWAEERDKLEKYDKIVVQVARESPSALPFTKVCVYCFNTTMCHNRRIH